MLRLCGALALLLLSFDASAAPDAHALYDRGIKHYRVGEFEDAIADFKAAYELDPSPVLLFNLAQAHRQLGDDHRAAFFYRQFVAQSPPSKARSDAEAIIAELEGAKPAVVVPAPVVTPPDSATPPPSPVERGLSHRSAVALVATTAVLGGALVFTGVGLSIHARDESRSLEGVATGTTYSNSYASRYDSGRTSDRAAIGMYVVGGAALATSVVAAIVCRHSLRSHAATGALSWSF